MITAVLAPWPLDHCKAEIPCIGGSGHDTSLQFLPEQRFLMHMVGTGLCPTFGLQSRHGTSTVDSLYFLDIICAHIVHIASVCYNVLFFFPALSNIANAMLFLGQRVIFLPEPCFSGTANGRPGVPYRTDA